MLFRLQSFFYVNLAGFINLLIWSAFFTVYLMIDKTMTDVPVCVGFGISSAEQVTDMLAFADGVIVGSYLMERIMADPNPVIAAHDTFRELIGE